MLTYRIVVNALLLHLFKKPVYVTKRTIFFSVLGFEHQYLSPIKVSVLFLTQAAPGLCETRAWFHEASLLLCEGITGSRGGQAEAWVQHRGSANQASKRW